MAEGKCPGYPETPCRVNLELMPDWTYPALLIVTAVALLIAAYGFVEMVRVWRKGRAWSVGGVRGVLRGGWRLTTAMVSHRKFMQTRRSGSMHAWIFFGFMVLFVGTVLAAIDMDVFEKGLDEWTGWVDGAKLLQGHFYLIYEATLDAFGVVLILGILYAMKRRYVDKPSYLPRARFPERPHKIPLGGDFYALAMLLVIVVTGYVLEGMRLRHQIDVDGITYAQWSFVGYPVSTLFMGWSQVQLATTYQVMWWVHALLWTSVLAVLPWTKFKHIFTSGLNVLLHDPDRQSRPALPKPFDLQEVMESGGDDLPQVGYATIRDLTWKDRLALDACTNCGRCEAQCPATKAGRPLSPRKLIQDLKAHMWEDHYAEKQARRKGGEHQSPSLTQVSDLETQIEEATLWSCVTCRACVTECPVDIEHVDLITEMRRALVMESRLDGHQQKMLMNLTNAGNPYGLPMADRADWRGGLPDGVEAPTAAEKQARGEAIDVLWWVGCVGSFDPRNQKVTRSVARILNAAGVDFAILGTEEKCTGDPARRLGEEGRFQQSVMENLMVLEQYGVKKVLTQCPHCFNTLLNEYPEFGADLEVMHHSQFIERLIEAGKVPLKEGKDLQVTFHDSCYLGRHNGIFDAPRNVLKQATGLPVLEMEQNRERGLCCGAGGSNMWFEIGQEKERINVLRVKQAQETEADTVASACPFCLTMVSDGIGLTGNEGRMEAKDIAEIVAEHLDDGPKDASGAPGSGDAGRDAGPGHAGTATAAAASGAAGLAQDSEEE